MIPLKVIGLMFALAAIGLVLMPAKFFFALCGVAVVGFGIWWLPNSAAGGVMCILGGILLVAIAIRTAKRDSEEADREAKAAQQDIARKHRLPYDLD